MIIHIQATTAQSKGGWVARAPKLKLAGAGKTESEAVDALKRIVMAYCAGLRRDGTLVPTLERNGLQADAIEDDGCQVDVKAEL